MIRKSIYKLLLLLGIFFMVLDSKAQIENYGVYQRVVSTKHSYSIGKVIQGKKNGTWVYYSRGRVTKITNYQDDTLNGSAIYFSKNNIPIREVTFYKGQINGLAYFYSINGTLLAIFNYSMGRKIGGLFNTIDKESPPENPDYVPDY